jgi:predicted dehydrogenase
MLANEKLDLLLIGSPNHLHLEHIKIGLNAGVKIFAEKPIVVDENQSFELAKLLGEFGQDQVLVGLVLRYSQHARSVRDLINKNALGNIISIEASEHIMPWHGGFFMRNWRRKEKFSGGFMLEKCCHDIDFYNMIVGCRPKRVASFGGRRSFIPDNKPEENFEEFSKYNLFGWEAKEKVFDSDADIVDHQVAIIEYENGATLAFHTNMRVPDEFRRFAVIGTNGMVEGDFVRGFIKAHNQQNNIILDEDYGAAFGQSKGHYGADNLMLKDINQHLTNPEKINLPVGVKDCIEAGLVAMKIDESRTTGKIVDLTPSWNRLDDEMKT